MFLTQETKQCHQTPKFVAKKQLEGQRIASLYSFYLQPLHAPIQNCDSFSIPGR